MQKCLKYARQCTSVKIHKSYELKEREQERKEEGGTGNTEKASDLAMAKRKFRVIVY